MYPLDRGLWGATTRITQLRESLARRVELDVISGTRARRSLDLLRYLLRGRMRHIAGIYVENSTALPGPADIAFLATARVLRIPVVTYVRDAQQLFREYYPAQSLKQRLSRALFRPATAALMAVSSVSAFPSRGLAVAILGERRGELAALLPPGARVADAPPLDPTARALLFVGAMRYEAHGGDLLLAAIESVRAAGHDVRLIVVARQGEERPGPHPDWVDLRRAQGPEIDALLPAVLASITPRRRTPYNDLAVPIKVLEYLGYGRPLIVTDATETAAIVRDAGCGLVVADDADALADGITRVLSASRDELTAWGEAARRAAIANSWDVRAARVLELLEIAP
jgi:glycosyltransferase involved in cell wall biosynthesis